LRAVESNSPTPSFARDTEALRRGEKFGETASSRQERQFSGVLRIAQSPAHGAISLIASENPQTFKTAWRSEVNSNCRYRFVNSQTTASG
jgi:hypothetical protein